MRLTSSSVTSALALLCIPWLLFPGIHPISPMNPCPCVKLSFWRSILKAISTCGSTETLLTPVGSHSESQVGFVKTTLEKDLSHSLRSSLRQLTCCHIHLGIEGSQEETGRIQIQPEWLLPDSPVAGLDLQPRASHLTQAPKCFRKATDKATRTLPLTST